MKPFILRLTLVYLTLSGLITAQAQSNYEPYTFSRFAGETGNPGNTDGPSSLARFYYPDGVAVDRAGNVYVADIQNSTIRKITAGGLVSTVAGLAGTFGRSG